VILNDNCAPYIIELFNITIFIVFAVVDLVYSSPTAPTQETEESGRRILVVEPQPINRGIMLRQLRGIGMEAKEAETAGMALARIAEAWGRGER
jgi:hypothetical protein